MHLRFFALLVFAAPACVPALAAPEPAPPPLDVLIDRVIARDAATQKALQSMQYRLQSHTEQLDDKGAVTHHEEMEMLVQPGAAQPYKILSVSGDKLPSDLDQAAEGAKNDALSQSQHDFSLKELAHRFNVNYDGATVFKGQKAYILSFSPKANQPAKNETERVVDQLQGRMWIRAQDDAVLQTEADLSAPVNVLWIVAQVKTLHFHYELDSPTSVFCPALLDIEVEIDAPLIHIRQRQGIVMTDARPR
jgi:hypothetical protein